MVLLFNKDANQIAEYKRCYTMQGLVLQYDYEHNNFLILHTLSLQTVPFICSKVNGYHLIDACYCTWNLGFSQALSSFVCNMYHTVSEQTGAVKKQLIINQGKTWITSSPLLFLPHRSQWPFHFL